MMTTFSNDNLLGTPETSLSGRSTLKVRRVDRSGPVVLPPSDFGIRIGRNLKNHDSLRFDQVKSFDVDLIVIKNNSTVSRKQGPISYSNLLYKIGHYFPESLINQILANYPILTVCSQFYVTFSLSTCKMFGCLFNSETDLFFLPFTSHSRTQVLMNFICVIKVYILQVCTV